MARSVNERLKRIEQHHAAMPSGVEVWEDTDGVFHFEGQKWGSLEEIIAASGGKYNSPEEFMLCGWSTGVGMGNHDEAVLIMEQEEREREKMK